jgi:flagellar biosynthetic protein FliQ
VKREAAPGGEFRKRGINHERVQSWSARQKLPGRRGRMSGAEALDLGRETIWLTVLIMAGPMLVGLIVGLAVSLLQTLTQVQEQTLVFVPKILSIFFAVLLFLPIMGGLLGRFTQDLFLRIASQ